MKTNTQIGNIEGTLRRSLPAVIFSLALAGCVGLWPLGGDEDWGGVTRLHLSHVHRGGGARERPDNTLATFKWCWENGSAVECDCRKTKDGVGIMLHDETLLRTGRGISKEMARKSVSKELTWDEIKNVDVGSYLSPDFAHHRIPTIEETFAAMKGHPTYLAFVDEKGAGPEYIAAKAVEAGVQDQVYYTGPSHENIIKWNETLPGGKSLLWLGAWPNGRSLKERNRVDDNMAFRMSELRKRDFAYISAVSIHTYYDPCDPVDPFIPSTATLKAMLDEFHAHGIPVASIPFSGGDKEGVYWRLHEMGFDGFSSDYPSTMFAVIRDLKLRADPAALPSIAYAQWNIGHFAMGRSSRTTVEPEASAARAAEYRAFLKAMNADVIGISEFEDDFDTAKTPSRKAVFADYPNLAAGPANNYQWNALMTKSYAFKTNIVHDYAERCQHVYWLDNVCEIAGREVHFVQSHLDWDCYGECISHRTRQIRELVAEFRDKHYVVISADFNVDYDREFDQFREAGFELAVGGRLGRFKTFDFKGDPSRTEGIDNVIVKGFAIEKVEILDSELKLSDHAVVKTNLKMLPPEIPSAPVRTVSRLVVLGEEPSLLPEGEWKMAWHDEFNGKRLDDSKWGYRTNFWGRRATWFAQPSDGAVEVTNGLCRLKIVKKPDGQFVSPQLQTGELLWDNVGCISDKKAFWPFPKRHHPRFLHRYGYYECRAKVQRMPGWWSAFWMQAPANGATLDAAESGIEHDIMECFKPGEIITHCFHRNGYGADYRGFDAHRSAIRGPYAPHRVGTKDFHRYGLLWEEDGYTVFLDGRQCGEKVGCAHDEAVSKVGEFLLITTECKHYRDDGCTGKGAPELEAAAKAGDAFEVDYVRVFDRCQF